MEGSGNLLCVANFPSNTGYAWDFIEGLYAGLADDLARSGVRTWVAYPRIETPPATLADSAAEALELVVRFGSVTGLAALVRTVRRHDIRAIYLTDRASWHPGYAALRLAGVRCIVVHDHTSGARTPPTGVKRALKRSLRRFRPALADLVLAVSEYVGRRKVEVDLVDPGRVKVVWNSVEFPATVERGALRELFRIPEERPVVASAGRAAEYKGIQHLMAAFDQIWADRRPRPVLVYFGDGPYMGELRQLREQLESKDDIILAGYRPGAADLLGGADICAVPSTWQEAFGLAALEPAARGVPVVASRVGGIPEVVEDGTTGLLVAAGDVTALARALGELLDDPSRRSRMGEAARRLARERFDRTHQMAHLRALFRRQLGLEDG